MASFMVDLWESIFTPGPTAPLLKAANASFASLQLVLLALLLATYNVHCVVLSVLCAGLWWSVNWFAAELKIAQEEEKRKKRKQQEEQSGRQDDSSDTEVEGAKIVGGKVGREKVSASASASAEVEARDETGELKKRGDRLTPSGAGTQSSAASTEDEWEKVSESEKEKDK